MEIYADNIDQNGKVRKIKNISAGNCIFPFKYKKKTYKKCIEGNNGKWCPTSLTKNGSTKTWGFCKEVLVNGSKKKYDVSLSKGRVKKKVVLKKKTKKNIKRVTNKSSIIIDTNEINKLFLKKKYRQELIQQIISKDIQISNINISKPYGIENNTVFGKIVTKNKPCDILSFSGNKNNSLIFLSNEKGNTGFPYHVCINNCNDRKGEFVIKIIPYVKDNDLINSDCKRDQMKKYKSISNYNDRENESISVCIDKDPKRPEHAESKMLYLMSDFVYNNLSPHFTLPIMSFQCKLTEIIKNYKGIESSAFLQGITHNVYIDKCLVIIAEWADKGDLKKFIRSNVKKWFKKGEKYSNMIWGVIFFQLLQMLICIFKKYPNFRHNDLKVDNLLVTENEINEDDENQKYYLYKINKYSFVLPNVGFQIKLWDYDLSCIKGVVDNYKVEDMEDYGIRETRNQYYDLHCFLNYLRLYVVGGDYRNFISKKVSNFWRRIIPLKYRYDEHLPEVYWSRIIEDNEVFTPLDALTNELKKDNGIFTQFIKKEKEIKNMKFIDTFVI